MAARWIMGLAIAVLLTACGGGGDAGASSGGQHNGSTSSGGSIPGSNPPSIPIPDSNPGASPSDFGAIALLAPEEGANVKGVVRLEVQGSNMRNVELLPESGYEPRIDVFKVAPDGSFATLDFDTRHVPNGPLTLRISAFSAQAGEEGADEAIAMQPRTWVFSNDEQPAGTAAGRAARCQQMGFTYTGLGEEAPVVCIRWEPPSPPVPPEQCTTGFGTPYAHPEDALPVLRNGSPISKLYCIPEANNGVLNPGCVCSPQMSSG